MDLGRVPWWESQKTRYRSMSRPEYESNSELTETLTSTASPRMAPKSFPDRPINKLLLFDVDGTLTPARQVFYFFWLPIDRVDQWVFLLRWGRERLQKCSSSCLNYDKRSSLGSWEVQILRRSLSNWPSMVAQVSLNIGLIQSPLLSIVLLFAVVDKFDYGFAENGLTAYKLGKQLPSQSFIKHVGEESYKPLVNFILHHIADLDIPIKRCASAKFFY